MRNLITILLILTGCAIAHPRPEIQEHDRLQSCIRSAVGSVQAERCKERSRQRCLVADMDPDCGIDWSDLPQVR